VPRRPPDTIPNKAKDTQPLVQNSIMSTWNVEYVDTNDLNERKLLSPEYRQSLEVCQSRIWIEFELFAKKE